MTTAPVRSPFPPFPLLTTHPSTRLPTNIFSPAHRRTHIPLLPAPLHLPRHRRNRHNPLLPPQKQAHLTRTPDCFPTWHPLLGLESTVVGRGRGQLCYYGYEVWAEEGVGADGVEDAGGVGGCELYYCGVLWAVFGC